MDNITKLEQLKSAPKITTCFVDLDNTLWEGILAEEQKPKLFTSRYKVLEQLHQKGIQLYIVSKNDQEDVETALRDLKLNKDLFTWIIANWDPKFVNIERLIRAAEIRPETAIFIDDNIFELNEVKTKIPAIHLLEAPNIDLVLSVPTVSSKKEQADSEIQERKNRYRTSIQTELLKETFTGSDIEFYRKLKRKIQIGLVPADNLDRAIRLLVETHRLNFSPGKFENYEKALDYIHQRFNAGDQVYAVATSEGEYSLGLVGALVIKIEKDVAIITDGSFSCGIIGRDFEQKTILALIDILKKQSIKELKIYFELTSTNVRLKEIVENLGFLIKQKKVDEKGNLHLVYDLEIKNYITKGKYDWITISDEPPNFEYIGHPFVIKFFDEHVKPILTNGKKVVNLGSARGEVLGLLQPTARKKFYKFIEKNKITYTKIDMEYYPDEQNTVANAENLSGVFGDETQDVVMAVELLEHTQKPWLILSEMIRICKNGGYIFITVPSYSYAKHEYPIDMWRFGPKTLQSFFKAPTFKIIHSETEGDPTMPRRSMILVKKVGHGKFEIKLPVGKMDTQRGLTVFD